MSLRRRLRGVAMLIALVAAALLIPAVPASADPPPGIYNLKNEFRNLSCLAGRTNGAVSVSQCVDSFTDQYWRLEPDGPPGNYKLQNQISGLCLAMFTVNNGDRPEQITCVRDQFYPYQYWTLGPTPLGESFQLRSFFTQKCLVALKTNGRATQSTCVLDFADQWWRFVRRG